MIFLHELAKQACESDMRRGFMQSDEPDVALLVAKVHGEVAEAFEAWRCGGEMTLIEMVNGKPEGFAAEAADALILLLAFCHRYNVPVEEAAKLKLAYNNTRPPLNGKRC